MRLSALVERPSYKHVGKRDHLLVVELLSMAFVKGEPKSELFEQLITHRSAHLALVAPLTPRGSSESNSRDS